MRIEVISGEDEARLAYLAAVSALELPPGELVVFDTGGGSSQFTFGHGTHVDEHVSVEVGAVRFTERFGLDGVVSEETLARRAGRDRRRPRRPRTAGPAPRRSSAWAAP